MSLKSSKTSEIYGFQVPTGTEPLPPPRPIPDYAPACNVTYVTMVYSGICLKFSDGDDGLCQEFVQSGITLS